MHRILLYVLVLSSHFFVFASLAVAQKSNSKQDERKENERVAKANREVANAKKDLGEAHQELRSEVAAQGKASLTLQQMKKKLRETREEAEDRLGAKIGIPEALSKVRQAGTALEQIANGVRQQIHETPAWLQANQASEGAKKKKAALLDDVEQSGQDNDQLLVDLAKQVHLPVELEDAAISKDPKAMEATKLLAEQQSELDKKRKLLPKGEVDRDRKVVQVIKEIEQQEKTIVEIDSKIKRANGEARKIQKRLADAQVSLQRAKAADAADSNRPKKNNGK